MSSFRNIVSKIGSAVKTGFQRGAAVASRALGRIGGSLGSVASNTAGFLADSLIPTRMNMLRRNLDDAFDPFAIEAAPPASTSAANERVANDRSLFGPLPPGFEEIEKPIPNGLVEYVLPDGKSIWRHTNQKFEDVINKRITSSNSSDKMSLSLESDVGIPRRYAKRVPKEKKENEIQGAWFPYLLKEEIPMDLSRYGVFKKSQLPKEVDNCLLHIFRKHPKFETLAVSHYGKYTNQSELKDICRILDIKIILYKWRSMKQRTVEYGTAIDEKSTYHIGLFSNHYFKFETTEYQAMWVKKAIWMLEDTPKGFPKKITKLRKSSPLIKSLHLLTELVSQKDIYLEEFGTEIYDLHYQSGYEIDLLNPKFSLEKETKETTVEYVKGPLKPSGEPSNVVFKTKFYADIETNTSGNHEPYLFCVMEEETGDCWTWRGEDCVKKGLNHISYFPNPLVYFHNLGYDSKFIVDKLYNPSTIDISSSNCVSLDGRVNTKLITFHDTYAFLSCGLASFAKMFNLSEGKYSGFPHSVYVKKTTTDSDRIKSSPHLRKLIPEKYHYGNWVRHMDYAIDYCKMDVKTLRDGFVVFKKWIKDELDIDVDYLLTSASLAHHYIKLRGCYEGVFLASGVTRAYMQKALVGGRTMIALDDDYEKSTRTCEENLYDFDAVSLYPSAMMRMKGSPKGRPKVIEETELTPKGLAGMDDYFITIRITKVGKKLKIPCMSKLGEKGERIWTNDMVGDVVVVNKLMLEDYVKFHEIEFDAICGLKFDEGFNDGLVETMKSIFELRNKLKKEGNPAEKVYKLIMNSCYGKTIEKAHNVKTKFIQKDEFNEYMRKKCGTVIEIFETEQHYRIKYEVGISNHFTLPQVGCSVLAMSKRIMNEVFAVTEGDVQYTDTDSMFITDAGLDKLRTSMPDIVGSNPGQFHIDFEMKGEGVRGIHATFLAPKTYCVRLTNDAGELDYHVRMKGISKNAIDEKLKEFESPTHMFDKLLNESLVFDLLAGDKVRFEFLGNLTVRSVKEFSRTVGPFRSKC